MHFPRFVRRCAAAATVFWVASSAGAALAAWSATGTGAGRAAATGVPAGPTPAVSVTGRNVTVSWPATTLSTGDAVTGYSVRRVASNGATATIGASCNTVQTGLSCTETAVAPGTWSYGIAARVATWSGSEGTRTSVTVAAPAFTLSSGSTIVGSPGTATGTVSGFAGPATLSFRLDNATTGLLLSGTPTAVPASGQASVSVTMPSGVTDGSHTLYAIGSAGDAVGAALTVDATRPQPTVLATADGTGSGSGGVDPGDSVTITFSEPLLASSLCSAWANDGAAKSLTAGVTVAVANNASPTSTDLMSVTATGCGSSGFHFGTVDLGSKGYVKAGSTANFGPTPTSSTVTWDPATATLRIVFGSTTSTKFGTVNSSVATYTPDPALTDLRGLAITGTVSRSGRQL